MAGSPSNSRPQPIKNSVSPVKALPSITKVMAPRGMRRHFQHLHLAAVEFPARRFVHADIDAGNARRILGRAHHLGAELLLQVQVAAAVIQVVMGVEDVGQPPAACLASAARTGAASDGSTTAH